MKLHASRKKGSPNTAETLAIREKDLNPLGLVIKEIIHDFQLNNLFIVDQGL